MGILEERAIGTDDAPGLVQSMWRYRALVIVAVFLGVLAGLGWSRQQPVLYEGTSRVLLSSSNPGAPREDFSPQAVDPTRYLRTQTEIISSMEVMELASRLSGLAIKATELRKIVTVAPVKDSDLIEIRARHQSPEGAAKLADTIGVAYQQVVAKQFRDAASNARIRLETVQRALQDRLDGVAADLKANPDDAALQAEREAVGQELREVLTRRQTLAVDAKVGGASNVTLEKATIPEAPVQPQPVRTAAAGALLGLVASSALAWSLNGRLRGANGRLRGREDLVERLERPVLATIPPLSNWVRYGRLRWRRRPQSSLVTLDQPNSPAAESYRTLRTRMARLASQLDINSVMVVSAGVGEGKSTTAANLAVVLAETGKDVLLVSADLRRPRLHQFFGLPSKSGLSNVLGDGGLPDKPTGPGADRGQTVSELWSQLWSVLPNLWVIPSGPPPPHPSALMDSDAMRQFLKERRDLFDFIVLDCPPALVVADALALAPLADAVLVVADAKESDREAVSRLKEELEQVGGKIVGAVLNRSSQAGYSTHRHHHRDTQNEEARDD